MKIFFDQLSLILIYSGIVQGLFVALLLNNSGIRKSRANVFLSILLIALSFSILHTLYAGAVLNHFGINAINVGDPSFLLIAPLLWFYTKELTGDSVNISVKTFLHFIPFIFLICFSLLIKRLHTNFGFSVFLYEQPRSTAIFFWIIVVIQFSFYQFFIHRKWLSYQKLMVQEVSNTEDVNIYWVRFFMGVFLLINFFFLISLFAVIHLADMMWVNKTIAMIFSLSIFALGYKGITQKEIFRSVLQKDAKEIITPSIVNVENKPDQKLIDKLHAYMEDKKPYLDAELTLSTMANQMNISRSQLSQLINEGIGDNFYNFINKYRVEQVKKFMTDPAMKHFNLLGLALEAGFKSKSTFNLIFKRFTGLTPTAYRNNILE